MLRTHNGGKNRRCWRGILAFCLFGLIVCGICLPPEVEAQESANADNSTLNEAADAQQNVVVSNGNSPPKSLAHNSQRRLRSYANRPGRKEIRGDWNDFWSLWGTRLQSLLSISGLLLAVGLFFATPATALAADPPLTMGFSRAARSTTSDFPATLTPISLEDGENPQGGVFNHGHPDVRFSPQGNGMIPIGDVHDYPRIPALDVDDEDRLFATYRPNLIGQDVPEEWDFYNLVNTDRPDFTDATFSVGKGVTIIESGYTFRSLHDREANVRQTRRSLPEVLLRHGITDELEIRVKWNGYVMSDIHDPNVPAREQLFGNDDMYLGVKYEVWQQAGWRPMLTFVGGTTVPTGTNGISSYAAQPFANFVVGWGIRRWLYLKASTGIDWQHTSVSTLLGGGSTPEGPAVLVLRDNINLYHASVSLLFQASKRVGGFAEFFSLGSTDGADNRPSNYFDTGIFYYLTPNTQLDFRYGTRLSERSVEYFTGTGFSVRF